MERLPPLNAIRTFEVTGRLASVARAADELCVTAAAVSRQIKVLEDYLGFALFFRGHRRITLTPAGAAYLSEVSVAMAGLRQATSTAIGGLERRVLKIRAPATIAVRWLIPRLASFHESNPGIDVRLRTSGAPLDFENEDLDGGIEFGYGNWKGVHAHRLIPNEIIPVCTPLKATQGSLLESPRNLARETLLHTLARPDDWSVWMQAAGVTDVDLSPRMRYESSMLAFEAALEGHGIAIAQRALIRKELSEGRLITPCTLSVHLGDLTYYFLLPKNGRKRPSRELETFRRWIVSIAEA